MPVAQSHLWEGQHQSGDKTRNLSVKWSLAKWYETPAYVDEKSLLSQIGTPPELVVIVLTVHEKDALSFCVKRSFDVQSFDWSQITAA